MVSGPDPQRPRQGSWQAGSLSRMRVAVGVPDRYTITGRVIWDTARSIGAPPRPADLDARWWFRCETARAASVGGLDMVDCLAATRSWWQRGRPRSGARERSVIAVGYRSQGASGAVRP